MAQSTKTINVTVDKTVHGERLDVYVSSVSADVSRSLLKTCAKSISVNGSDAKLSKKVNGGDEISVVLQSVIPDAIEGEDIPLDVLYEDEHVTVVNKKQGMVTHPACGNWNGTLVNALLFRLQKNSADAPDAIDAYDSGDMRPGIVHRLDKDTSGVLITARDYRTKVWLQSQFKERRVKKEYIAIVMGTPPQKSGSVKTGLIRDPRNRKKFTWCDIDKGKFAHTLYRHVASYGPYSLIKVKLKTGRTHQIRVHMKYLGCPILGDPIYGKKDALFDTATLMLHSFALTIRLGEDEKPMKFVAPIPIRFKKVLRVLHASYKKSTFFDE